MTATLLQVTEPGVYDDMPNDVYHADPVPGGSLSSSGARKLLPPNCPARFAYERNNPSTPKREYDLGHAAHLKVLGAGPELVIAEHDDWRTKAARQTRDIAHAEGKVPLLAAEHDQVEAMAAALRANTKVGRLFHPSGGKPEQSLFWIDKQSGVWCRARLDWMPHTAAPSGRLIIPDYKTCRSAAPDHIRRDVWQYGYALQADWYCAAVKALGLCEAAAFVFIFQEKEPPYLITVATLDPPALRVGARLNRDAIRIYADCTRTGVWPAYSDDVELISLPPWIERQYEESW
jgi:hypothetical protein